MSDFDTVLERLLFEPAFAAALAADPGAALAGYRLTADEAALLHSQVTGDSGGQTTVEVRANQSSVFGMLSPLAGMVDLPGLGLGGQAGAGPGGAGLGDAPPVDGFGAAAPVEGFGAPAAVERFGPVGTGGADAGAAAHGFGAIGVDAVGAAGVDGFGAAGGAGFGAAESGFGAAGAGSGLGAADPPAPPDGYRTRVDVDGDGDWDRHILLGRADGGVDILVDLDHDGHVDFVGRDDDADGRVDSARYDKDHDGWFEKRSVDDDGDGWLDRSTVVAPPEPEPVAGPAPVPPVFGPGHGGGPLGAGIRLPDAAD